MKEITQWFNSAKDFKTGVALYMKHGTSESYKRILANSTPTQTLIDDLAYELGQIAGQNAIQAPVKKKKKKKKQQISAPVKPVNPVSGINVQQEITLPDEVQQLIDSKNRMYKEACTIHAALTGMPEDEREKAAFQLLDLWDMIQQAWAKIDYWREHKHLPGPPKTDETKKSDMNILDLITREKTLQTYISKYKKKVKISFTEKARIRNQAKLDEYLFEQKDIQKKIQQAQ